MQRTVRSIRSFGCRGRDVRHRSILQSAIRKSGHWLSEKIMLKQKKMA